MLNVILTVPIIFFVITSLTYYIFNFGKRSPALPELVTLFRSAGASGDVASCLARNETLPATRAYREEKDVSLNEAKQAIRQIMLDASKPDLLIAAGIPTSVVTHLESGNTLIAIKAYRDEKKVSLREAKAIIYQLMELTNF